jgi:hypothetical protein
MPPVRTGRRYVTDRRVIRIDGAIAGRPDAEAAHCGSDVKLQSK